jgi:hypothetical protein
MTELGIWGELYRSTLLILTNLSIFIVLEVRRAGTAWMFLYAPFTRITLPWQTTYTITMGTVMFRSIKATFQLTRSRRRASLLLTNTKEPFQIRVL